MSVCIHRGYNNVVICQCTDGGEISCVVHHGELGALFVLLASGGDLACNGL